jgi:hypothetical protein
MCSEGAHELLPDVAERLFPPISYSGIGGVSPSRLNNPPGLKSGQGHPSGDRYFEGSSLSCPETSADAIDELTPGDEGGHSFAREGIECNRAPRHHHHQCFRWTRHLGSAPV